MRPLAERASFLSRSMFGCVGCYLDGRIVAVLADRGEPWEGLLVPTERRSHASLLEEFPALRHHPALPKWLYLSHRSPTFDDAAHAIVERIAAGDERFGVEPPPRRLPRRKPAAKR